MNKNFDTAVLMLFFIRDDTFSQAFEAVRKAKPKKLYLFQDGPRENRPNDIEKILKCRKICENIDWDCEVHRNYQTKNLGCDTSQFTAFSWGFENEEELIIMEDDVVPSESFFIYCDEMLHKYKNDKDVFLICGRNQLGESFYDKNSYFFTRVENLGGAWASWYDRWNLCDYKHEFLLDKHKVKKIRKSAPTKYDGTMFIKRCQKHRAMATETFIPSFESPIRAAMHLNDMLSIVPRVNLAKNIGITGNSAHTAVGLEGMCKKQRQIYLIDAKELEFPLIHPSEKIINKKFFVEKLKILGTSSATRHFIRRVKGYILRKLKK